MKITVCIGSYCHLKGSRQVVERLRERIEQAGLQDQLDLAGTFCLGQCQGDVSVTVDNAVFSVSPASVDTFFDEQILAKIHA